MKRVRRRKNSGSVLSRSNPDNISGSGAAATQGKESQPLLDGMPDDSMDPLLKTTTMNDKDGYIGEEATDRKPYVAEEQAKKTKYDFSNSSTDKKNQKKKKKNSNVSFLSALSLSLRSIKLCPNKFSSRLQQLRHFLGDVMLGVPLLLWIALAFHTAACVYSLWAVYWYHQRLHGSLCAFFFTVLVSVSFTMGTITAIATARTATLELDQMLDQEGKSRAILNSLYPQSILEQMYMELQPEQIEAAQRQIHEQMEIRNACRSSSSTTAIGPMSASQQHQQEPGPVENSGVANKANPTSSNNDKENEEIVVIDRHSLGYDDDHVHDHCRNHTVSTPTATARSPDRPKAPSSSNPSPSYSSPRSAGSSPGRRHSATFFRTTHHGDDIHGGEKCPEIVCLRKNSLSLRRQSMSQS